MPVATAPVQGPAKTGADEATLVQQKQDVNTKIP